MTYEVADKAIKAMNRENLKLFGQMKARLMKADELHIIREVSNTYDAALRMTERHLFEVARDAYRRAMEDCGKKKRNPIDRDWILDWLEEESDPAVLYKFIPEWERKKARLIEALPVAQDRGKEIDKALKELARMLGWFAVAAVDKATVQAFKDAGVEEVIWRSEHDERVCVTCHDRDGKVYRLEEIPDKHVNCRCRLYPVLPDSRRETA